ncbi:hypothetical protein QFC19_001715 [Naganishia cerealis]|uniref:Uncharacterized protein n=1 Tax=Naganishia cerealis TaxID=610337 RepID=A0ACC2WIB4_9TREE|nr:hypothetical protein QFC19_001715 [Naganishia cerealis]
MPSDHSKLISAPPSVAFLDQAKQAATAALNTATNVANQATAAAQPTLSAAYNSASNAAAQATAAAQPALSSAAATVASTASAAATQAQAGLHSVAPSVIPAPSAAGPSSVSSGVDTSHDLSPHGKGTEKLEQFLEHRPAPQELQNRNILKGSPNDALAGKKADLMRAQLESKLEGQIAHRPAPEELVKEGILQHTDGISSLSVTNSR